MPEIEAPGAAAPSGYSEAWKAEYEQINANFRMLADIRFKLLALVPTLGGVAVFLLSRMAAAPSAPAAGNPSSILPSGSGADYAIVGLLSVLGFLATLGITVYDLRNSEFYELLVTRGKDLDRILKPQLWNFEGRVKSGRHLLGFVLIKHDIGLALIYAPVLGAWVFPMVDVVLRWRGCAPSLAMHTSLVAALIVGLVFFEEFVRLDIQRKCIKQKR